jgi:predicted AlkP superfamily pyrophosphatase or phosphodiesterase
MILMDASCRLQNCRPRALPALLARSALVNALLLGCLLLPMPLPADSASAAPENAPDQRHKPCLVLVSIDAFRWDFAERYGATHIASIGERGLQAQALRPAFPTLTFPNHYSIATGVLPSRHGLVANEFPNAARNRWYFYKDRTTVQDGSWYLAEPIWVTAERAGLRTAAYFFVGTEADVSGIRPTHWNAFDADISGDDRVQQVLEWLAEPPATRPHLVTLYFEDVDESTHWYGPDSAESQAAIHRVDGQVGRLLEGIAALPHGDQVYVILVSDHGIAPYRPDLDPLVLDELVDISGTRVVEGGPYAWIYFETGDESRPARTRDAINAHWDCGRAMLPEEAPADWQLAASPRFPDLLVQADPGCAVISSASERHKITAGDHGWAPDMPEMSGVFYAMGPGIPPGTRPGVLSVTDVYPLMLSILGLTAPATLDGQAAALSATLPDLVPSRTIE